MTVSERQAGEITIVEVSGNLRLGDGAEELGAAVKRLLQGGRARIVLNAAGIGTVDSAGLGALVQAYTSATKQGGGLKLVNTPKRLGELLVITKLARVLESCPDEATALAAFR